jgi:sulfate adenylyltransferase
VSEQAATLHVDDSACLEIVNLATGVFAPLTGFMSQRDHDSVVASMHTDAGEPWTIPVSLEVPEAQRSEFQHASRARLCNRQGTVVGCLEIEDVFRVDGERDVERVFGTSDRRHPGVQRELCRSPWRVGGRVTASPSAAGECAPYELTPADTKSMFRARNWRTVVGFQTRNPPHRAHEHLQRIALEVFDGLFIQPLVGWKQPGDFRPEAVVKAYEAQIRTFYPSHKVLLSTLRTPMRYAGPREAVFHAIIRRNFGCTHFIVGRDHAGVGGFYGIYEAQALCREFTNLGITVLPLGGPFFCSHCDEVVTENSCDCGKQFAVPISGSKIRDCLKRQELPPASMMRREIVDVLVGLEREQRLFCD